MIDQLLRKQYDYMIHNSLFYKQRLERGELPDKISGAKELAQLPFTQKQDFREFYPFGFLASDKSKIVRYGESTGTSGKPTASYITKRDWEENLKYTVTSYSEFFSEQDTAIICIPYELAFSAIDIDRALSRIGVTVIAAGALNKVCPWERTVQLIKNIKPTILVCSGTRAIRLFDMMEAEGLERKDIGLKYVFYVGEAVSLAKVKRMEEIWGVKLITAYGSTETNTLSLPCKAGYQHLNEERYYCEVLELKTGQPAGQGEKGELVVTSLQNEAMPVFRYKTGDLVAIDRTLCECGNRNERIIHHGRIEDQINLNGNVLSKVEMENLIFHCSIPGFYYNYYQNGNRELVIEVEKSIHDKEVKNRLQDKMRIALGIIPQVHAIDKKCFTEKMDSVLKPGKINNLQGGVR
ncbi:AMP-binding protein [Clostridium sp. KNHs205]|uniref:phenylacetate--CoA ligase family protein n=1 Tax=Clostridium sp. KNHs205 TaxID=1449050 RepID=UPI00068AB80A|nr:AMP-binding protein [Clostridium sp. KNHs205]